MSTKSRARARRRHPELEDKDDPKALGAVGTSILTMVTLGMLEPDTQVAPSSRAPVAPPAEQS